MGPRNQLLDGNRYWQHLANTNERSVHGGNAEHHYRYRSKSLEVIAVVRTVMCCMI